MKRKIIADLNQWKKSYSGKPYMLTGARQVGKTHILREFCEQNFNSFIYINLEYEERIREVFELTLKPEEIVESIELLLGKTIEPRSTVIFFDEIQVSERAVTSLKYFNESPLPYKIVCAGSLLGVALNRFNSSFPVGKIFRNTLHSMDFQEFLWGIGKEKLDKTIRKAYINCQPLLEPVHRKCLDLYRDYLVVGGMPASILEYNAKEKHISRYDDTIKRHILDDYLADMSKYTTTAEQQKIRKAFDSIPKQLGNEGRFSYKIVDDHGSKRKYETSIDWLTSSNIISKSTLIEVPRSPLKAYEKDSMFKLYMNDTGLLLTLAGMKPVDLYEKESAIYRGMLTENYAAQTFNSNNISLHYWKSRNNAEIDFLINLNGKIIPVEVKAAGNTKSKSLKVYRERYNPSFAIKLSANNFNLSGGVKSIPLYAAYMIGSS